MRFLVIGCGSIGKRHIGNLKKIGVEVLACDLDSKRLSEIKKEYDIKTFTDINQALKLKIDGALVCTPTYLHIPISLLCAKKGINLFIEKPLSHTLDGIDELIGVINRKNLVTLVGCNTRFFPSFKLFKELVVEKNCIGKILSMRAHVGFYLPYWRPGRDYRTIYSSHKSLGGGVILDDIHEIDYFRLFLGEVKEVFCFSDKLSDLKIDVEDIAEILLKFQNGAIAEIHFDCIQPIYRRSCEAIGEKGIIIWDYINQTVVFYSDKNKRWETYSDKTERNEMFLQEIQHFISCIEGKEKPVLDCEEATRVLEIALAAKRSSETGKVIKL